MIESLRNLDLIKGIDEKMNFPERRKAGTTQAHCLVILHYCPQSFSGGGLYLKVNWLLRSVYDGLLWSVKNGLLWYMGHTSIT